jgi:hypothetical protein
VRRCVFGSGVFWVGETPRRIGPPEQAARSSGGPLNRRKPCHVRLRHEASGEAARIVPVRMPGSGRCRGKEDVPRATGTVGSDEGSSVNTTVATAAIVRRRS